MDAALRRSRGDDRPAARRARGLQGLHAFRAARAAFAGGATHAPPHPLLGMDRASLGRPRLPRRLPLVQHSALLAGPDTGAARADRPDAGRAIGCRLTQPSRSERFLLPLIVTTPM